MKVSFKQFLVEAHITSPLQERGVLDKPTLSVEQLATLHKTTVAAISSQLKMGIKVEQEHTSDKKVAREIALDHLKEDPKYYDKLKKVEASSES